MNHDTYRIFEAYEATYTEPILESVHASTLNVDQYGNRKWRDSHGLLHRKDGPASEYKSGTQVWYIHGVLHRENGPAVINAGNGYEEWWQHGKLHRIGGPAVDGDQYRGWWQNGELHRLDGPATIQEGRPDGWWLSGVQYRSPEEWAYAALKFLGRANTRADVDSYLRKIHQKEMDDVL